MGVVMKAGCHGFDSVCERMAKSKLPTGIRFYPILLMGIWPYQLEKLS